MAIRVEINGVQYPASITGRLNDKDWNGRASKAIELEMAYADAMNIFMNDVQWSIVQDMQEHVEKRDENGDIVMSEHGEPVMEIVTKDEVYDNSEYNIAGDIIDHRNGKITVKMGKPTAEEMLAEIAAIEYEDMLAMDDVEV